MTQPQKLKKRTAANILACWFSSDIRDVQEGRYQPTWTKIPVNVVGNDYYCSPATGDKVPANLAGRDSWLYAGCLYDREIWVSKGGQR